MKYPKTLLALGSALMLNSASAQEKVEPKEGQSKVQIAILLDTSGSMSGLIEQTKTIERIVATLNMTSSSNRRI